MSYPPAVPCAHIAAWYQRLWEAQHCIGYNLLRHGYRAWSEGKAVRQLPNGIASNNLY